MVGNVRDAAAAVLAAVRGADLLVLAEDAPRDLIDRLCDDLRRLGPLDHRIEPVEAGGAATLSADQRTLIELLLGGATLGEAAANLHIARRTADRRLAAARQALGASSTSEALVIARRSGLGGVASGIRPEQRHGRRG